MSEKKIKENKRSHLSNLFLGKQKSFFIENLSTLISAGINILNALDVVGKDIRSRRMKKIIAIIKNDVESGMSLWRSLHKLNLFHNKVLSLIKMGEESGNLVENLQTITIQIEKENIFKSRVRSSLLYFTIVSSMTIVVGVGSMWFVLPQIATTFENLNVELPLITRILLNFGRFIGKFGFIVVPLFASFIIIIVYFLFSFPRTKFVGHLLLYNLPGIKQLIKESEIAQFGYTLGTLLKAGIPIIEALDSLQEATTFKGFKNLYAHMRDKVSEGETFQKSFASYKQSGKYLPLSIQQVVIAAEQSGSLEKSLMKIGKKYEDKLETTARDITTIMEPLLLLVVGIGVATFALSIFVPIYSYVGSVM